MSTTLDIFKKKTGYNIKTLFDSFIIFTTNHHQNIINYYNGGRLIQESFVFLEYLSEEVDKVEAIIEQYSDSFNTVDFWDLNNTFSDIQTKLETCQLMGKWQRSSRLNEFSSDLKVTHIQKQNETIEKMAHDAGFTDPNKWAEISLRNQKVEEDYSNKGGAIFTITLPNNINYELDNVIDYLIGENIYGKDVVRKIEILSDGDLKTIYGKDNLKQIFEILMSTIRGSIPEFPNDGVPSEIFGTNENIIQYPIILRSILNMIQKDKRFTAFDILDINKDEDSIFIEVQASTITGDTLVNNIII